jgi:integrase/recombinase XerD
MGLGKQAKVLTSAQQNEVFKFLKTTRYSERNRIIFLLSFKAGLRAKEIASITWSMVIDSSGGISDCIAITDTASKGNSGGVVWMNSTLRNALQEYKRFIPEFKSECSIVQTERSQRTSAQTIINLFASWYKALGFEGCSSHSGRRTFITSAAKHITAAGGSIRDVQMLARHKSLSMTQKYIEADIEAMKKVVEML